MQTWHDRRAATCVAVGVCALAAIVATAVGAEAYYYCGGNFYRAVFQGNQLVYVTTKPK